MEHIQPYFFGNTIDVTGSAVAITLGDSVKTIGDSAFYASGLTSITIPDSVTTIGDSAFGSNQLSSVIIPSSVTSIGDRAFAYNQLTSVTIPDSVTTIGEWAFADNQLTSITIPSSVTSVGEGAFAGNAIASATIEGDPTVGQWAFSSYYIKTLSFNGVVHTPSMPNAESCFAFDAGSGTITGFRRMDFDLIRSGVAGSACLNTTIAIPSSVSGVSVTSIGQQAIFGQVFTSVTIPNSVTSIGQVAFANNQLTSVTIPASVTFIGDGAFIFNQLTSVTILGNPDIGDVVPPFLVQGASSSNRGSGYYNFSNALITFLYAPNMTAPNLPESTLYRASDWDYIFNEDDDASDIIGALIVNTSSVIVNYRDTAGNTLAPSKILLGNDIELTYKVSSLLAINPSPTNDDLASLYYSPGETLTLEPVTIDGYSTPVSRTVTLAAGRTTINFVYTQAGADGYSLADTGANLQVLLAGAVVMLGAGGIVVFRGRVI